MKKRNIFRKILPVILAFGVISSFLMGCSQSTQNSISLENIPEFSDQAYVILDDNQPNFSKSDKTLDVFETYSPLDDLGRCGTAYANICTELMPTEERGSISSVKPSGWQTAKYDFVDGKYLYNRCHLIGYQLAAENANQENLITGTRYLNVTGMLPFENQVADYVKKTGNHVLYRVTPIFQDPELVARGVEMEAWSVEDNGTGVCFHIYAYNNQPGVTIDYATGQSWPKEKAPNTSNQDQASAESQDSGNNNIPSKNSYIINIDSGKFHTSDCALAQKIKPSNRENYDGNREDLIKKGYEPCGQCKP